MNIKLLKNRDFRLLMGGKAVSMIGSNMQQFVLSLYVLSISKSTTLFATVLAISIIPRIILSPIAGVFGDWFNRKNTIVIMDLINGIVIFIFAILFTINGELTIPMIYALVIILEVTEIFFSSAMAAVIPSIVEDKELVAANSFNSLIMNLGNVASSLLGAIIYGLVGMKLILLINSASFILSAVSEMFINIPKNHKKPQKISFSTFIGDFLEGIKVLKDNKFICKLICIGSIINFCVCPIFNIGVIYMVKVIFECNDLEFAIFNSVLSISMISAPILCRGILKKKKIGNILFMSFVVMSLSIIAMAIAPTNIFMGIFNTSMVPYILILVLAFLIGMAVTVANIAIDTLFQRIVPMEAMGRTTTVLILSMTVSIPLGQLVFGGLYDIIPIYIGIIVGGIIMMISTLAFRSALINTETGESRCENI